jgi:hypothetical protein
MGQNNYGREHGKEENAGGGEYDQEDKDERKGGKEVEK